MGRVTNSQSASGYSLIELLVVLAILAGVTTLSLQALPRSAGVSPSIVAGDIVADARLSRAAAIASRRDIILRFNMDDRWYEIEAVVPRKALPRDYRVTVTTARGLASADRAAIVFFPDGSSSGGRVELSDGRQSRSVRIDWLTGLARLEE